MDEKQKEQATRGNQFFDTRYSPVKFITTDDDRGRKEGDLVYVAGDSKVYGPYMLDKEIGRGNGKIHWKAVAVDTNGNKRVAEKPKTKAELEQENANLLARLAKLEAESEATQ